MLEREGDIRLGTQRDIEEKDRVIYKREMCERENREILGRGITEICNYFGIIDILQR